MIPLFKVIKSGVYSSIQDRGRFGFRKFGVPVSGPMDREAFESRYIKLSAMMKAKLR